MWPLVRLFSVVVVVGLACTGCQRSGNAPNRQPQDGNDKPAEQPPSEPRAKTLTLRIDGGITFECIHIEPGRFLMGSPDSDKEANDNEKPQREVRIEKGFYLGRTTVTVGQFRAFVQETEYKTDAEADGRGGHGYNADLNRFDGWFPKHTWRHAGWPQTDEHPVGNVSWNDAVKFCEWLSRKSGKSVRLPTEAEWEYTCRAGTTTRFFTGDDPATLKGYANVPDEALRTKLGRAADAKVWFPFDDGYPFTAPVGRFKPNAWGLHDMLGNVWQWCGDEFADDAQRRVSRGGSYNLNIQTCRCAVRGNGKPESRYSYTGFRVAVIP
jgi:formylglycine-generating enzyme required for sulfatase activity